VSHFRGAMFRRSRSFKVCRLVLSHLDSVKTRQHFVSNFSRPRLNFFRRLASPSDSLISKKNFRIEVASRLASIFFDALACDRKRRPLRSTTLKNFRDEACRRTRVQLFFEKRVSIASGVQHAIDRRRTNNSLQPKGDMALVNKLQPASL
jgi:hypothetical protein